MADQEKNMEESVEAEKAENQADQEVDESPEAAEEESQESEIDQARQEADEYKDRLFRLAAEFENYKKRIERERSISLKYAEENVLKELLPTLDNLGRAIEQGRADNSSDLLEGVEMTYKGLLTMLEKFGLEPLASVGQPFDPNFHEALATEVSDEIAENHVLLEYEKGYLFKDRLLRPAKVVVSKGE